MQRVLFIALFAALSVGTTAHAQFPPDSVVNLKVLPEDTPVREVIGAMRGFAQGLGVRCQYCHVGEAGQPLSTFDFASDEKPNKAKAREMLRMVMAINGEHLANLPERSDPAVEVNCATCHHGLNRPVTLASVLLDAHSDEGIGSTVQQYRDLRAEYYGSWTYDFTEGTLNTVVQQIARSHPDDAIQLLNLNKEFFAESPAIHLLLGQTYLVKGDTAAAIQNLEQSIQFSPRNPPAQRLLRQLRGN